MRTTPGTWSLRARLTAAASLVILLLLGVAAGVLVWRVDAALRASTDAAVRREVEDVAGTAAGPSPPRVPSTPGTGLVQITDARGRVVASSPVIDGEPLAFRVPITSGTSGTSGTHTTDPRTVPVAALDDAPYRVAAVSTGGTTTFHVYVALPLSEVNQSTTELAGALAVGVPLLAVAFAGLTWLFAGRALKPVETLRRQATDISLTDLHRRLDVPGSSDELQRLALTLNDLLERLDGSLSRQRQFVADAAHELRSPVAAIRTQAEVADHVAGLPAPSALAAESVRLTHLVDDLLALARIDAEPHYRRERVDLDDIVLTEASLLRERASVMVDTTKIAAAQVTGDAAQLSRAVRNVLDNAARYAVSRITISLQGNSSDAELVIRDEGPGIPETDRERVKERFTRLDDTRTRATGGVGLGLAIVDDVVTLHGGQLRIEDGAPGARIVIILPLAVPAADHVAT